MVHTTKTHEETNEPEVEVAEKENPKPRRANARNSRKIQEMNNSTADKSLRKSRSRSNSSKKEAIKGDHSTGKKETISQPISFSDVSLKENRPPNTLRKLDSINSEFNTNMSIYPNGATP